MSAEHIWNDLRSQRERPIFRRVNENHPHDLYLGIDVREAPVLMLLSSRSVEQMPRLKSLDLSQNIRQDGKFAILITLSVPDLLHPFSYVCDDLIEGLRHFNTADGEAPFLLTRLENWRRLLEATKKALSHEELLGLLGELLFLEQLIPRLGSKSAIDAWLGPTGTPQDFQSGGHIYEIKVCPLGAHTVIISSLDQLHTSSIPTSLVVFSIGSAGLAQAASFSANSLVTRIRNLIQDPIALSAFDGKLLQAGFDEAQVESDSFFIVDRIKAFDVRDGFPRLTPLSVPQAIVDARYSLDLDHCREFEVSVSQALDNEP